MTCPKCGGGDIILITYGAPPLSGAALSRAIEEKSIVLGGCLICEEETPAYFCRACEHRFGDARGSKKKRSWFHK